MQTGCGSRDREQKIECNRLLYLISWRLFPHRSTLFTQQLKFEQNGNVGQTDKPNTHTKKETQRMLDFCVDHLSFSAQK